MATDTAQPNLIDRFAAAVSPKWAVGRAVARTQLSMARNAGAASRNRFAQSYNPASSVRSGSLQDLREVAENRDRARHAFANNVIARSLLTAETDYIVAEGFNYQARSSDPKWNAEAEERYYAWLDEADASGRMTGSELQRAYWTYSRLDGDGAIVRSRNRLTGKAQLQYVPGDLFQAEYGTAQTATFRDGIQTDAAGRPLSFTIASINEYGAKAFTTAQAADVSFLAHPSKPLDLRGNSVFATVFELLDQLDQYTDSVTKAAILACVFGLIHRVNNPAQAVAGLGLQQNNAGVEQRAISLENGMLRVEGTNESTYQVSASQPMTQTPDFIRTLLRMICLAFDMPLEVGSRDLSQVNFSGGRIGLLGFYRACQIKADKCMTRWKPNVRYWLDTERERQRLGFTDAFVTPFPADYAKFELQGREYEANDRLSEAQADALEISIGKKSPQQVAAVSAGDYEVTRAQIKAHLDWCEANKVPFTLSTLTRDPGANVPNKLIDQTAA